MAFDLGTATALKNESSIATGASPLVASPPQDAQPQPLQAADTGDVGIPISQPQEDPQLEAAPPASLSSGFSLETAAPVDIPTRKIYHEDDAKTYEVPGGLKPHEESYVMETAGRGKNPNDFVGGEEIGRDEQQGMFNGAFDDFIESVKRVDKSIGRGFKAIEQGVESAARVTLPDFMAGQAEMHFERDRTKQTRFDQVMSNLPLVGNIIPTGAADMALDMIFQRYVTPEGEDEQVSIGLSEEEVQRNMGWAEDVRRNTQKMLVEEDAVLREDASTFEKFLFEGGSGFFSIGASIATGGVAIGILAGAESGNTYRRGRAAGLSVDQASSAASAKFLFNATAERFGVGYIMKVGAAKKLVPKVGASLAKKFGAKVANVFGTKTGKRVLIEGAEEGFVGFGNIEIDEFYDIEHLTLKEKGKSVLWQAAVGVVSGYPAAKIISVVEDGARRGGMNPKGAKVIAQTVIESDALDDTIEALSFEASPIASTKASEQEIKDAVKKLKELEAQPTSDAEAEAGAQVEDGAGVSHFTDKQAQAISQDFAQQEKQREADRAAGKQVVEATPEEAEAAQLVKQEVEAIDKEEGFTFTADEAAQIVKDTEAKLEVAEGEVATKAQKREQADAKLARKEIAERKLIKRLTPEQLTSLQKLTEETKAARTKRLQREQVVVEESLHSKIDKAQVNMLQGIETLKQSIPEVDAELLQQFSEFSDLLKEQRQTKATVGEDTGAAARMEEIEVLLSDLDRTLGEKGITFDRAQLNEMLRESREAAKALTEMQAKFGKEIKGLKKELAKDRPKALADRVSTFTRALRVGEVLGKNAMAAAQREAIRFIRTSGLDVKERGEFLTTIPQIKDARTLASKMDVLADRIERKIERINRRNAREELDKILKVKTTEKPKSGRKKGKFGVEKGRHLDTMKAINRLTNKRAQEILEKRENFLDQRPSESDALLTLDEKKADLSDIIDITDADEELQATAMLTLGVKADGANVGQEQIKEVIELAKQLMAGGKAEILEQRLQEREKLEGIIEDVKVLAAQGESLHTKDTTARINGIRNLYRNFRAYDVQMNEGWEEILDILLYDGKGTLVKGKKAIDDLSVWREEGKEEVLEHKYDKLLLDGYKEVYEKRLGKNPKDFKVNKAMREDIEQINLGKLQQKKDNLFVNAAGIETTLIMSKAEMRQFYAYDLAAQSNDILRRTLYGQKGKTTIEMQAAFEKNEGNFFTEEMREAILSEVNDSDRAFVHKQMEAYETYYDDINPVYSKYNHANLAKTKHYTPLRRKHSEDNDTDQIRNDRGLKQSTAPGGTKARVANITALDFQPDILVFKKHNKEMSHYIASEAKMRTLNKVFRDPRIKSAILARRGKVYLETVQRHVEDMTRGAIRKGDAMDAFFDKFMNIYAGSALAGKLIMTPKQLSSAVVVLATMDSKQAAVGMKHFIKDIPDIIKDLSETAFMQKRGANPAHDIAISHTAQDLKIQGTYADFIKFLSTPIKWGDRGAIYMAGGVQYAYDTRVAKMSKEKALERFVKTANELQQSRRLSQKSLLQRKGGIHRMMTMFLSSPNIYLKQFRKAWRMGRRGEISKASMIKRMAIFGYALPSLFTFISDELEWEWENQKISLLLGPLAGWHIAGQVINSGLGYLQGKRGYEPSRDFVAKPFFETGKDAIDLTKALISGEDVAEAAASFAVSGGQAIGLPAKQAANVVESIFVDAPEGEIRDAVSGLIGTSRGKIEHR